MSLAPVKQVFYTLFFLFISIIVNAQKLPKVQQESVYASADIKIDGKATEWGDQFQAYNHATELYYIMANDDKSLYLIVQVKDKYAINRIVGGGITLYVNKEDKKTNKGSAGITFPVSEGKNKWLQFSLTVKVNDSVAKVRNKLLQNTFKRLKTTGMEGLDEWISLYKEDGIKAAEFFDGTGAYNWKLTVPLKCLGLNTEAASKFAYHIVVNGRQNYVDIFGPEPENATGIVAAVHAKYARQFMPTDFWGEYTLAKK